MKILLSADCFYPAQLGGPSNSIYWQAKALTQAGHDITVVATSQALPVSIPRDQWLTMDCGQVIYTRNPHFYLPIKHIWYGWRAIQKADIVHLNSLFYPASFIWMLMSQLAGKSVVWSPHGELSPVALRIRPRLKRLITNAIRKFRRKIWFHATGAQEMRDIRRYFGLEVQAVEIRSRMELPELIAPTLISAPYLLFIGRLHPIKGIDHLLMALSASDLFRESAYILKIAGPETDKTYTRLLVNLVQTLELAEKVSFIGSVEGELKEQLYANARLTILPSHTENFGNVVIESLAQGTPVVASTNTPWRLLETERAGSWVSNEPDQLRQAIETYLVMPPQDYNGYRMRAFKLAHEQFSIQESAQEWVVSYERIWHGDRKKNRKPICNAR